MAKRRIDYQNLAIAGVVLILIVGACVYAKRKIFRADPKKLLTQGALDFKAGNFQQARDNLLHGLAMATNRDPAVWTMLADSAARLTPFDKADHEAENQMKAALAQAVLFDPGYTEAQHRLLKIREQYIILSGGKIASLFDELRDTANKILAANPKDTLALYTLPAATVDQFLSGAATDQKKLDDAAKALQDVQKSEPTMWRATSELTKLKLARADELVRARDLGGARQAADDAEKIALDALKGHDDVAGLHNVLGVTERRVAQLQVSTSQRTASAVNAPTTNSLSAGDAEILGRLFKHWKIAIDESATASKLADPKSDDFSEFRLNYIDILQVPIGDPNSSREDAMKAAKASRDQAEAVLRDSLKLRPAELQMRVALAELLAKTPSRIDESIAVLEEQHDPDEFWAGARGRFWQYWQGMSLSQLADTQLDKVDQAGPTVDAAARTKLINDVQPTYEKLVANSPNGESNWRAVSIQGRMAMARGKSVDATQLLRKALIAAPQDNSNDRFDLMYRLAQAYVATQQTGEAKATLREVIAGRPGLAPARILLADLLIREQNIKGNPPEFTDGAVTQVNELEKMLGADNPGVINLRLATLDKQKDKKQIDDLFAKVPETNAGERYSKAALAERLERSDDVIRLLKAVLAEQPTVPQVVQSLVHTYMVKNDKASALKAVDDAIAKDPSSQLFKNMKLQIENPSEARDQQKQSIEQIADPLRRSVAMAEVAQAEGDPAKAIQNLQDAEKTDPTNLVVAERLFLIYLDQKDFNHAGVYLEKLSKNNADQADGQIYRVRFAAAQGKADDAFQQAKALTDKRPEFSQSWAMLGMTQQAKGKYEDAIGSYQQALERQTENVDAIRGLIACNYLLNRPGQRSEPAKSQKATDARYYIELGEKLFANAPAFQEMDAQWELRYGDPNRVVTMRYDALQKNPDTLRNWLALSDAYLTSANAKNKGAAAGTTTPAAKEDLVKSRDNAAEAMKKFDNDARAVRSFVEAELQLKEIEPAEKAVLAMAETPDFKGKPQTAFMLSEFYGRAGNADKSASILRDYLAANPTAVPVEMRLAGVLTQQGKSDEAIKVLSANANDPGVQGARIDALLHAGKTDEAISSIDAAIAANPTPLLQKLRARIDMAMQKPDDAVKRLTQVIAANPSDFEALYLRGSSNATSRSGDLNVAIDDLNKVLTAPPDSITPEQAVDARVQLSQVYKRRGLETQAIQTLESAINQMGNDPGSLTMRLRLIEYYSGAKRWFDVDQAIKDARSNPKLADNTDLANAEVAVWIQRKDPARAVELARPLVQKAPDNPSYAQNYYAALLEAKNFRALLTESDAALKKHPEWWWVYPQRAAAKKRGNNDPAGAAAEFSAGLAAVQKTHDDPGTVTVVNLAAAEVGAPEAIKMLAPLVAADPKWLVIQSSIQQRGGDVPGAIATIEKAMADPKFPAAQLDEAKALAASLYLLTSPPDNAKAIKIYRDLIKKSPDNFTVLNNLAFLLLEPGPTQSASEAVQYAQHVYDLSSRTGTVDPLILDTYGWALVNAGRADEGISMLRDALQRKQFVDLFYHLGSAYLMKKPPQVADAERTFLDGQKFIIDTESNGQTVDPAMKAHMQQGMDAVKLLKK